MIDPTNHIEALIATALTATCKKDLRAAAVVDHDNALVSIASNGPPPKFQCRGDGVCMENCGKVAVHAEMRAMLLATAPIAGAEMVHLRVNAAGRPMLSGIPRCFQCSKHMLDAGVAALWLLREHGWERWPMDCAHAVSLDFAMLLPNHDGDRA